MASVTRSISSTKASSPPLMVKVGMQEEVNVVACTTKSATVESSDGSRSDNGVSHYFLPFKSDAIQRMMTAPTTPVMVSPMNVGSTLMPSFGNSHPPSAPPKRPRMRFHTHPAPSPLISLLAMNPASIPTIIAPIIMVCFWGLMIWAQSYNKASERQNKLHFYFTTSYRICRICSPT